MITVSDSVSHKRVESKLMKQKRSIFRAWNLGVFEDGMNDILYLDYGNSEQVPDEELCETVPEIWNIPPIVKPFRAAGKSAW